MAKELEPRFGGDEGFERAKTFWKQNGRAIITGVVLGVTVIGGYNGWQWWQQRQGERASLLYENLLQAVATNEVAADEVAVGLNNDLRNHYGSTPYAGLAALTMAKRAVEAGNLAAAGEQLRWVLDQSKDQVITHIARLRLAMVMLATPNADAALDLIDAVKPAQFAVRYAELKGDAYVQKNDFIKARIAYKQSQRLLAAGAPNAALLKLKLDSLGAR